MFRRWIYHLYDSKIIHVEFNLALTDWSPRTRCPLLKTGEVDNGNQLIYFTNELSNTTE